MSSIAKPIPGGGHMNVKGVSGSSKNSRNKGCFSGPGNVRAYIGCKNVQNWKKGCVFGHIDKFWKRTWQTNLEKCMQKCVFRSIFIPEKYVIRVLFVCPWKSLIPLFAIRVPPDPSTKTDWNLKHADPVDINLVHEPISDTSHSLSMLPKHYLTHYSLCGILLKRSSSSLTGSFENDLSNCKWYQFISLHNKSQYSNTQTTKFNITHPSIKIWSDSVSIGYHNSSYRSDLQHLSIKFTELCHDRWCKPWLIMSSPPIHWRHLTLSHEVSFLHQQSSPITWFKCFHL